MKDNSISKDYYLLGHSTRSNGIDFFVYIVIDSTGSTIQIDREKEQIDSLCLFAHSDSASFHKIETDSSMSQPMKPFEFMDMFCIHKNFFISKDQIKDLEHLINNNTSFEALKIYLESIEFQF